jgi:WD40 repeat protein
VEDWVGSLAATADGGQVVAAGYDGRISIWSVTERALERTLSGHAGPAHVVAVGTVKPLVASGGSDRTIRVSDLVAGAPVLTLTGHLRDVRALAFSPDEEWLVSGSDDRTIRIWRLSTGECVRTIDGHTGAVRSLAVTPDGRSIVSGGYDGSVRIWGLASGLPWLTWRTDPGVLVNSLALIPGGRLKIAYADTAGGVHVLEANSPDAEAATPSP